MNKWLIILDRDGVINVDSPDFIKSPAEWFPIPGSLEMIAQLTQSGHTVVVSTNQSGITRGLYGLQDLVAVHRKMHFACQALGGRIDRVYFCPHTDEIHCSCRKPKPGMLWQISKDYDIDLSKNAVVIGDSWRDIEPAIAVNCRHILVRTGNGQEEEKRHNLQGVEVYNSLADCSI